MASVTDIPKLENRDSAWTLVYGSICKLIFAVFTMIITSFNILQRISETNATLTLPFIYILEEVTHGFPFPPLFLGLKLRHEKAILKGTKARL